MSEGLHHLLRAAAQQRPDHPLFERRGVVTTYGEIDRASSAFAASLRERGVEKGQRVALVLDNLAAYPICYYGALKAGAAVVPLCPDTRPGTLSRALSHSEARAVVLETKTSKLLAGLGDQLDALSTVYCLGKRVLEAEGGFEVLDLSEVLAADAHLDDSGAGDADLAAVMYTSGTTALPKGVMLSHRNLLANTRSCVEYLELKPDERLGLVLPLFYSYGNSLLHTHICVGGTLVDIGTVAFPAAVLKGLDEKACTGLSGVPSTFARLLHTTALDKYDLTDVRYLTQAGGPMTPALTEKLLAAMPNAKLYVMYGQTEAAPRLSYLPPEDLDRKLGSVGKAIPGVTLRVLDAEGNEVEPGVEGELVAQGDNVMLGYLDDPAATAKALRPEGLRTGDLARRDKDGYVYIIGRNTDMMKAGAHRIAPQEIEAVIEKLPEVAQCAVAGIPDELLGEAIAAFIVRTDGAELDEKQVMRACYEYLPRFKMPGHVVFVDTLPRTDTGKLRRSELKSWQPPPPQKGGT
ncbi:MAG: AMP-dependent synthetase [Deltaproteobacteria bacterium]|nr:MAG: AMP-dependent synthetase [Pseudomonadota bacterium]PIE66353.1 MAG: AMP-dependent synthetase [Deltaproteobacteria bacterium]